MTRTIDPLVADLVAWCAASPRGYADVMDAWRTSCPRLMVWEEAVDLGLVETRTGARGLQVVVTERGREHVAAAIADRAARPRAPAAAVIR